MGDGARLARAGALVSAARRMTRERWERVKEIFCAALERPREERAAFSKARCGTDAVLFEELSSLLAELERTRGFLERGPGTSAEEIARRVLAEELLPEQLPALVHGFHVERVLGRGGMGVVYLARQDQPRRSVALKVMSAALVSPRARRRFEHEVEVLARLQHPGIAQIHEAGTFVAGGIELPYFAMEFVQGARITEHARARSLGLRERLELFVEICDAVEHAHQKGIVHRDLKADNVLVDARGRPKVLDFGIAHVSDADLRSTASGTLVGELVGTLGSMSPEQARGDPAAIDTRTDVYALGVLLYELLAGAAPYDLSRASVPEALRIIERVDPPPLGAHARELRGDLETIVAKAMEKDRERRYPSASALGAEVRRCLASEPITARPASTVYRLRKLARRQPSLVAGVFATFLSLCLGLATTTWKAMEARERQHVAEAEANKVRSILDYLQGMLASVDAEVADGRDTALMEAMLAEAAARVQDELASAPDVRASLSETIGATYLSIGRLEEAEQHVSAAVSVYAASGAPMRGDLGRALHLQARVAQARGHHAEAAALFERSLAELDASVGRDHPDVASATFDQARLLQELGERERAEALARQALELRERRFGRRSAPVANCLDLLGGLEQEGGSWVQAERFLREALDIRRALLSDASTGRSTHDMLLSLNNLAGFLWESGRRGEAEELWTETVEGERRIHPKGHPDVANALSNLAAVVSARGGLESAEAMLREARDIEIATYGEGSSQAAFMTNNLAVLLQQRGEGALAEELLGASLAVIREKLGAKHELTATALRNLGAMVRSRGDLGRAEALFVESIDLSREIGGERNPEAVGAMLELGHLLRARGELTEALSLYEDALGIAVDSYPSAHPQVLAASWSLADTLLELGEVELAIERLRTDLQALRASRSAGDAEVSIAAFRLGLALARAGEYDEAESLIRERCDAARRSYGMTDARTREALLQLHHLYQQWGKASEAEAILATLAR